MTTPSQISKYLIKMASKIDASVTPSKQLVIEDLEKIASHLEDEAPITHQCLNHEDSTEYAWWEKDAQGIPLCKVCEKCVDEKLSKYRPEILHGYTQEDVDEPIEEDY